MLVILLSLHHIYLRGNAATLQMVSTNSNTTGANNHLLKLS